MEKKTTVLPPPLAGSFLSVALLPALIATLPQTPPVLAPALLSLQSQPQHPSLLTFTLAALSLPLYLIVAAVIIIASKRRTRRREHADLKAQHPPARGPTRSRLSGRRTTTPATPDTDRRDPGSTGQYGGYSYDSPDRLRHGKGHGGRWPEAGRDTPRESLAADVGETFLDAHTLAHAPGISLILESIQMLGKATNRANRGRAHEYDHEHHYERESGRTR